MEFYTQYYRPGIKECPLEEHPDEGKVDRDGYIPTDKLVNQLIEAGNNLQAYRNAEFAAEEEIPDDYMGDRPISTLDALQSSMALGDKISSDIKRSKEVVEEKPVVEPVEDK